MKQSCRTCAYSAPDDDPDLLRLLKGCPYAGLTTDVDDKRPCEKWKERK